MSRINVFMRHINVFIHDINTLIVHINTFIHDINGPLLHVEGLIVHKKTLMAHINVFIHDINTFMAHINTFLRHVETPQRRLVTLTRCLHSYPFTGESMFHAALRSSDRRPKVLPCPFTAYAAS